MNYLKQFWITFKDCIHKFSTTEEQGILAVDETVARYLLHRNLYNSEKNIVRSTAFLPRDKQLEISVFRIYSLNENEIWNIGEKEVARPSRRKLRGRANILVENVCAQELKIVPDSKPNRHANIVNWPDDKPKRLSIAQELAKRSSLVLKPY